MPQIDSVIWVVRACVCVCVCMYVCQSTQSKNQQTPKIWDGTSLIIQNPRSSKPIFLHQLTNTFHGRSCSRFEDHFKRKRVGIRGCSKRQGIDGSRRIRFDVECPLDQYGIDKNGTVFRYNWDIEWEWENHKTHAVAMYCPGHTLQQE